MQVQMSEDKLCHWLCENRTFDADETKLLHKRITQGYSVHLYVVDIYCEASRVTTCLEHLEIPGNLTSVRDFTKSQGSVRQGKVA